jgi:hypothetical protein
MKYLRKYYESTEYDLAFIIGKITHAFTKQAVDNLLNAEILSWSKDADAYKHINNHEAEDIVLSRMIEWYEEEYGDLTTEQKEELYTSLQKEYPKLNF